MSFIAKECIEAFIHIGLEKHQAKVLAFLLEKKSGHTRDIERGVDMRQPEVCLALLSLERRGWVTKTKEIQNKKGRPTYNYTLAKDVTEIVIDLQLIARKEIERLEGAISLLGTVK